MIRYAATSRMTMLTTITTKTPTSRLHNPQIARVAARRCPCIGSGLSGTPKKLLMKYMVRGTPNISVNRDTKKASVMLNDAQLRLLKGLRKVTINRLNRIIDAITTSQFPKIYSSPGRICFHHRISSPVIFRI